MNVEDSYEGAVRRLQRLELAGVALESSQAHAAAADDDAERMRELEELALLACEDNERLKREFGAALQELDDARKEADAARAEVEQLRAYVASLQQAPAAAPASPPQQTFVPPPQPFALDEDFDYPPKRGKGAFYFFVVAIAGAAVAALCVMRPWDRPHAPAIVEPPAPPPPPVVTAPPPPPAPKVEPTIPKAATTVPQVKPTIPQVARAAVAAPKPKTRPARKHAKHHAAKKHASATAKSIASDTSDDPLGGTGL